VLTGLRAHKTTEVMQMAMIRWCRCVRQSDMAALNPRLPHLSQGPVTESSTASEKTGNR
jgi:hypothetical protein